MISCLTGRKHNDSDEFQNELARKLKVQRLSFNDYNEEKTNLIEVFTPGSGETLDFCGEYSSRNVDYSDLESTTSDIISLDEGAISVLTIDDIK